MSHKGLDGINEKYKDLKGKNIAAIHIKVAKEFIQSIANDENIVGAVLLGGAAKGFADEWSDIDIAIFVKDKRNCKLKDGERKWKGYDLDLSVVDLSVAKNWNWTQIQKWTYSEGIILYDPKGIVNKILREKVRMSKSERKKLIVERIMLLGWLGISYEPKKWRDYSFFRPPDLWIKRGYPQCAHQLLNYCIDACLDLLFLCNNEFIPDEKWKFYLSFKLKWLPENYSSLIERAIKICELNEIEFWERLNALQLIFKSIIQKLESQGIIPKKIYQYLLKHGEYYSTV